MESVDKSDVIDVDTMLWHAGDFGRYQFLLIALFSFINIFSAFHYFGQTFITLVPEYSCRLKYHENSSMVTPLQCSKTFTYLNFTSEEPCTTGWNYKNEYNYISLVEELNWICKEDWKPTLGQSVFFIGSVVGSLVFGILADRIGRLHVLVISNMLALIGNLSTLLSSGAVLFAISRFIAGCATDSNFVMMYIIVMEYIKPTMRTFGLNLCIGIFYCLSCMAIPWVSVLLGNWKSLLLVISLPHITILSFYFLVPESAQWLVSKGKTDEAITCFQRIARFNKRRIDQAVINGLKTYAREHITKTNNESLWGLFKTPKLRRKTCILIFKSMVMTLGYDAISRNVNGFGLSPFIIFSLSSSTIFPACAFILLVQDRIGRKALASGSLLTSGIFMAAVGLTLAVVNTPDSIITIICVVIARLSINVAYNSGAQYAVELIPTVVRGQGVSAIHVTGYAASFFSPQILYLGSLWRPFPEVILGVLLILGAVACLFLPETLNRILPVTLQQGEDFGEDESIFEFTCCEKNKSESTQSLAPSRFKHTCE